MKQEIKKLKVQIEMIKLLNKLGNGKYEKEIKKIEKKVEELKKADKEIWEE